MSPSFQLLTSLLHIAEHLLPYTSRYYFPSRGGQETGKDCVESTEFIFTRKRACEGKESCHEMNAFGFLDS